MNLSKAYIVSVAAAVAALAGPQANGQTTTFAKVYAPGIVASDALAYGNPAGSIGNNWGWHQSRIVRDSAGQVSLVYLQNPTVTSPTPSDSTWRLMSCCDSVGNWYEVTRGKTVEDVHLLLDPVTQRKTVIAYPKGIPAAYSSPGYAMSTIDASWPVVSGYKQTRQYGGAGVGADGTMCVKASHELSSTYDTHTVLVCGKYNSSGVLQWGSQTQSHFESSQSRDRHAYDYIYPGGTGSMPEVLATAQRDVLISGTSSYSFNGVEKWDAGISGTSITSFNSSLFYPQSSNNYDVRQESDSLVMSNSLVLSAVRIQPQGSQSSTWALTVLNLQTGLFTDTALPLPTSGYVRLMEPYPGHLYLLWTNRGASSEARIYQLTKDTSNGVRYLLNTNYQDISSQLFSGGRMIKDAVYISAPRGGTTASRNVVDAFFLTCSDNVCANYTPMSLYHFVLQF